MAKWNIITLVLVMLVIAAVGYVLLSGEYITPDKNVVVNEIEEPVELLAPGEVRDRAVDAYSSVGSYRFSMDSTVKVDESTRVLKRNGSVDLQSKKMQVMEVDGDLTRVTYLVDNVIYMSSTSGEWMKRPVPAGQDAIEHPTEMITNVDVGLIGEEKVDGVNCYVLNVSLDVVKALHLDILNLSEDKLKDVLDSIESVTLTEWISKDDYLIRKSRLKEVEVSGRWTETTTIFYDYNKPLGIELPKEALNAKEIET